MFSGGRERVHWEQMSQIIWIWMIDVTGLMNRPVMLSMFCSCSTLRGYLHETRNEISIYHRRNSVDITFHCGRNETNFVSGVA